MEAWIEKIFSMELLEEAAQKYNASTVQSKKLGDFENYVYEVHREGKPYILRLTHDSHRTKKEVEAEVQWINYLHDHGVNLSLVHPSTNGELVEEVTVNGSSFYVCLFNKAPGEIIRGNDKRFGPALFKKWGKVTGKMHKLTKLYNEGKRVRPRWDEDDLLQFHLYLKEEDRDIIQGGNELVKELQQLPETDEVFGLIHSDIHPGNFFYHEGEIHLFDFDDSMYFHYISDIAIPLYYSVWFAHRNETLEERSAFGQEMLSHFLIGYVEENSLSEEWLERIPKFLMFRDYVLYTVFHKKVDLETADSNTKELVHQIGARLKNEEPIVKLNIDKLKEIIAK